MNLHQNHFRAQRALRTTKAPLAICRNWSGRVNAPRSFQEALKHMLIPELITNNKNVGHHLGESLSNVSVTSHKDRSKLPICRRRPVGCACSRYLDGTRFPDGNEGDRWYAYRVVWRNVKWLEGSFAAFWENDSKMRYGRFWLTHAAKKRTNYFRVTINDGKIFIGQDMHKSGLQTCFTWEGLWVH